MPKWLRAKCARRPEMARAPTKLSARNVRTIIIHKTYVLARYVQCDAEPFWHANVQYNGEPFWHANVQCDAEPFWHAKVQCDAEPFWHANVQCDAEPFWHAESTV